MTEAATQTTAEEALRPATKPGRAAATLTLVTPDGAELKAIKYPMPLKAPRYDMVINDAVRSAAQTTFRDIKYTYFEYGGASFYVPGHLDPMNAEGTEQARYTFKYPEGYAFTPIKLDRKAQAEAAAKAKAAKAPAAPDEGESQKAEAGPVQADAAVESAGEGVGSGAASEASAAADVPTGKKGRKVSR